jgi:hypothetical protein
LFVAANDDRRLSFAGPSTVSKVAIRDTPLMQDPLNPRSVDPVFASGKPAPALSFARDRSLAPQGPEDHMGREDAIERLFAEWIEITVRDPAYQPAAPARAPLLALRAGMQQNRAP